MATEDDGELISAFRDAPDRGGVFCDFDGTLAEIVDVPDDARPVAGAVDVLDALVGAYRRVGVVSGRPAEFLRTHLGGHGLLLAGLYGLEQVRDDELVVADEAAEWRDAVEKATARATDEAPPGLRVEVKGLSVALHYRTAPDLADAAHELAQRLAESSGLEAHEGRRSWELRPPVTATKGTIVAEAAGGLEAACFLGDDAGDLAAFDALDALEVDGVHVMRVGVRSPEAPPELLERADVVVDGPPGALALLRRLLPD